MSKEHKSEQKVLRSVRTIAHNLGAPVWLEKIQPDFTPDEVIVRQVSMYDAAAVGTFAVWTSMIDASDGIMCTFSPPTVVSPGTHHKMKARPGDQVKFSIMSVTGGALVDTTTAFTGTLFITLEYIKHLKGNTGPHIFLLPPSYE
jgi:hypothetical protein